MCPPPLNIIHVFCTDDVCNKSLKSLRFLSPKSIHTSIQYISPQKSYFCTQWKQSFVQLPCQTFFILTNIIWCICSFKIKSLLFSALRSSSFTVCTRASTLTDNVAYEDRGRRMGSDDTGEEEGERQTDSLLKDRWSSATLKILSSMPSRTIGQYW